MKKKTGNKQSLNRARIITLGSLIYDTLVSGNNRKKGLQGWKDDKEKFKLELLNDIKNFLFTKWEKPWMPGLIFDLKGKVISGFRNISGRVYKHESNILSLKARSGKSPYFITLSKLKNDGGTISNKKKTLSILSFIPMFRKENQPAPGEIKKPDWMLPKCHRVINLDFVKGIKKPQYRTIDFQDLELNRYVENFVQEIKKRKRIPKLFYDQADQAFYQHDNTYTRDEIHLTQIRQFKDIEGYYSTLFHEIIHSTKNPKRLGRGKLIESATLDYANEELVAEMGAMIICSELGLDYNRQNSITYLKGWLNQTKGKTDDALLEAYAYACDAAEYLLDDIDFEKLVPKTMTKRAKCDAQLSLGGLPSREELRLIRRFQAAVGKVRQKRTIQTIYQEFQKHQGNKKSEYAPVIREITRRLKKALGIIKSQGLTHVKLEATSDSKAFFEQVKAVANGNRIASETKKTTHLGKPEATAKRGVVAGRASKKRLVQKPQRPIAPAPAPEACRFQVDISQSRTNAPVIPEEKTKEVETPEMRNPEEKVKKTKVSGLFTPITAQADERKYDKIDLPGDLGQFLGYVERYEYSILLRGEKGAGKTRLLYQMMNTFAKAGFKVGSFSLEIGKQSNIVKDMRNAYLSPTIASQVFIADSAPNGLEDIKEAARQFDVVCIDSWGKIPGVKSEDFDKLRKEFPKTMFIVIFQSTTNGTARGGSAPEYDAGIVIQVAEGGKAFCEKNRYSGEDLTYLVFERRLKQLEITA